VVVLLLLTSSTCFAQERTITDYPFFKSCEEASSQALIDIGEKNVKFYTEKCHYFPCKTEDLFDSLMLSNYDIKVIRSGNFKIDFSFRCYNNTIDKHMDDIHTSDYKLKIMEIINDQ